MRHKDMAKAFGMILRKYRKTKEMTQEALAEKADIDPKMISLIERFERNPSLNVADSIARGLGSSLTQMIKEAEAIKKK
ncbi:MAG TPA: helix-turn-helix transcriptional regulator [Verrucomicrobiae bacterium]|jgi:transcriptional regulator with XRE-family HTH domain